MKHKLVVGTVLIIGIAAIATILHTRITNNRSFSSLVSGNIDDSSSTRSSTHEVLQRPKSRSMPGNSAEVDQLPKDANGRTILGQGLSIDWNLRDPITAMGRCLDLVGDCYERSEKRSYDGCIESVATCKTHEPWNESAPCCPEQCKSLYHSKRRTGLDDQMSMNQSFGNVPTDPADYANFTSCFPGVTEMLR